MTWGPGRPQGGHSGGGTELAGGQQQHGENCSATLALGRPGARRDPEAQPAPPRSGPSVTFAKSPPHVPPTPPQGCFCGGRSGRVWVRPRSGHALREEVPGTTAALPEEGEPGRAAAPPKCRAAQQRGPRRGLGRQQVLPPDPSWGHPRVLLEGLSPPRAVAAGDGPVRWCRWLTARGSSLDAAPRCGGNPHPEVGRHHPGVGKQPPPARTSITRPSARIAPTWTSSTPMRRSITPLLWVRAVSPHPSGPLSSPSSHSRAQSPSRGAGEGTRGRDPMVRAVGLPTSQLQVHGTLLPSHPAQPSPRGPHAQNPHELQLGLSPAPPAPLPSPHRC